MPNKKLVQFLLNHNKKQSKIFSSPDAVLWRTQYRAQHPTELAAMKCMDGRLNLAVMTNTPPGIIQPFRNIGGQFDLGWPYFGQVLDSWIMRAANLGRDSVVLVTYHWSKGDKHRGCRGFDYDVKAARVYTLNLKKQIERVFGKNHAVVYPILLGIETDEDALLFEGENGRMLDVSSELETSQEKVEIKFRSLFPDMKEHVVQDLLPLVFGNIQHIREMKEVQRPVTILAHKEQILAVGRGFDWLHFPNKALIIGPYSYDLGGPITTAANILLENIKLKRIPKEEGVVLLASGLYHDDAGSDKPRAIEKAHSLARFAQNTIPSAIPELLPHVQMLTGIVNFNTRLFTPSQAKK